MGDVEVAVLIAIEKGHLRSGEFRDDVLYGWHGHASHGRDVRHWRRPADFPAFGVAVDQLLKHDTGDALLLGGEPLEDLVGVARQAVLHPADGVEILEIQRTRRMLSMRSTRGATRVAARGAGRDRPPCR